MGISIRKYAAIEGVSDTAVRKAIKDGRITAEPDGTINQETASWCWKSDSQASNKESKTIQPADGPLTNSFAQARTANEVLKAQANKVKLGQLKGDLVDRKEVEAQVFMFVRQERDSWLSWPSQVAGLIAAELRVDSRQLQQLMEDHVRKHLLQLVEVQLRVD